LKAAPKRILVEIVSDVLLQHGAVTTRRWLSSVLAVLKTKGFTIIAIVDPAMHSSEELQAVQSLFEGEIRMTEKEMVEGTMQTLKVKRMVNQRYLDREIILKR
jgi:hypothetical protein